MAEELRFQQGIGQRPAIDRHKRAPGPAAQVVQGPGYQFLAGAGLPLDQHGAVAAGDIRQDSENLLHQGGLGNDVAQPVLPVNFPAQVLHQAQVPKGLHPADDLALLVFEQRGADGDGDLFAVGSQDGDGLADHLLAGFQGMFQDAGGFADIGPEDLAARAAQGLGGRNAGDLLGGPVEEGDAPVEVNGEDPVSNAVQDSRGLGGQDRWSRGVTQARAAGGRL